MTMPTFVPVVDGNDFPKATQINPLYLAVTKIAFGTPVGDHVNRETLTANKTLVDNDYPLQSYDLSGSLSVTLPMVSSSNHPFYFVNRSELYELTINNSSGTAILILPTLSSGMAISDSFEWSNISSGIVSHKTSVSAGTTVSFSKTWIATDLSLSLAAGTYLITGALLGIIQADGTRNVWGKARLYDVTASAEMSSNYVQFAWQPAGDSYQRRSTAAIAETITLSATSTVRIEIYFDYGGTEPTWTTRMLSSDDNGKSYIQAIELNVK